MNQHQAEPTLRDILRIFNRRKYIIYGSVAGCLILAVLACIFSTRRYTSSSVVELQKSAGGSLSLENMMGTMGGESSDDSLSVDLDLMTEARILESGNLAMKVIDDLHLANTAEFRQHRTRWFGYSAQSGPSEERVRLLKIFRSNLTVKPIAGTRLIEVGYRSPDPKLAAAVANDLVKQLIDYSFEVRFQATTDASKWLEVQLGDLRNETTALEAKVVTMQKETGLFGVGGTDPQGRPVVYSPVLDRLQQSTVELSRAQANAILKGAVYHAANSGDAELLSELGGTSLGDQGNPGVSSSFNVIQNLRTQEAVTQSQIQELSVKFGPAYPKLLELKASLTQLDKSLADEISRVKGRARNDYEIAMRAETAAQSAYDAARVAANQLNDRAIQFQMLQREASQSQQLYQDLLTRLKEAGVIEGLHSSNLTVVEGASPAASPSEPRIALFLLIGLFAGCLFGLCAAVIAEAVDNRIRGTAEIDGLQIPVLGLLPEFDKVTSVSEITMMALPHSPYSEAVRGVRSALLLSRSAAQPRVVMVTSGSPAEGKTTVSLNLAAAFAQHQGRVLLIETDLRRPTMRKRLKLTTSGGLSVLLSQDDTKLNDAIVAVNERLSLLPAGPVPPYPAELLGSDRFREVLEYYRERFDVIVVDTPPVLPVADTRLIAMYADMVVLVVRDGATTRPSLRRAYEVLRQHTKNPATPAIGAILNAVSATSPSYYDYYGYRYDYSYYGTGDSK